MVAAFLCASDPGTPALLSQSPKDDSPEQRHEFDHVFHEATSQHDVYNHVMDNMLKHVMHDFNACCFAYGQPGSGKTYTYVPPCGALQRRMHR